MKKLLLALALLASPAQAQFATTTTTAPQGDSSNRIASTAFVQGATGGVPPSAAGQVLNSTGIGLSSWLATVTLGQNGGVGGSLTLNGSSSGSTTFGVSATGGIPQIPFTQVGTGAVARIDNAKLKDVLNAADFGVKCDGSTDDVSNFNAAITAANALTPGGRVQVNAGICIVGSPVQLLSNVALVGSGIGSTTIKLKNSVNVDVIDGAANLFGGSPLASATISFAQLSDMTIDGNKANNTSGTCVGVVGYRNAFINLKIQNCPEYGLHTELINDPAGPMESFYENILIDTTGKHGWNNNGPHDSNVQSFIVVDAGQATNNTWDGIFNDVHANFRGEHIHTWLRGSSSNRTRYGFSDQVGGSGGNNITTSNFEGSWSANMLLGAGGDVITGTSWFAAWNGTNIIIKSALNFVNGSISAPGSGRPASVGVVLGQGGDNAGVNVLDFRVDANTLGAVDFTHSANFNKVRIRNFQASGPAFIGTPAALDDVDIFTTGGATSPTLLKVTGSPWTAYTSSPTCGNGTVASNTARFFTLGKTTTFMIDATITAIGTTCAGAGLTFNLPNTTNSNASLAGQEVGVSGKAFSCLVQGTTASNCRLADQTNWSVNAHIIGSGVYENQ